jgi:hypothetical protein
VLDRGKNKIQKFLMRYSPCPIGAERGFFSLRCEAEFESGIGDYWVSEFDSINGIYRIG